MARKKKVDAAEEAKPTKVAAEPAEGAEVNGATEVTVKYRDHKGEETERTFSKEVHGEKFNELAEEFKTTNAARIVA